jgi:hypothetical protein
MVGFGRPRGEHGVVPDDVFFEDDVCFFFVSVYFLEFLSCDVSADDKVSPWRRVEEWGDF